MVPTPLIAIPTPHQVAALVYPSLDELTAMLPDTPDTHRFLSKVEPGPVPEHAPHLGPCLMWTRAVTSRGYSAFRGNRGPSGGRAPLISGHVWLWEALNGRAVPPGHELDHICHEPALCTAPAEQCPHRRCVLHVELKTKRANRLRASHITAVNAAKVRCDGSEVEPDPITGEKVGHLLTDEFGNDTDNVYRPPKNPHERKCRPCQNARSARWAAKARKLKAEARRRGLQEAGFLELI